MVLPSGNAEGRRRGVLLLIEVGVEDGDEIGVLVVVEVVLVVKVEWYDFDWDDSGIGNGLGRLGIEMLGVGGVIG